VPTEPKTDPALGEVLRRLRESRQLSVRTLAARAGFSPSFISQVETGQTSPSLASLERIATCLGVGLRELFAETEGAGAVVVRSADRPAVTSEWSRARMESLTTPGEDPRLEAIMVEVRSGGASAKRPHPAPALRFAMVWEGAVVLSLGDEEHRLRRGDAVTIPAGALHRWENRENRDARIVVVTFRA
jgi:transcriptional regulator with XRE-family HTH domain